MDEATIALTVMTGLLLISFLGFLVWGIASGQFKNVEEAKYQIFRNNEKGDDSSDDATQQESKTGGGDKQ